MPPTATAHPHRPADGPAPIDPDTVDTLARSACAGDRDAFNTLAERLRPRLVRVLHHKLGRRADAEDAAQAALLRWWDKRDAYDPARPFVPWLMTLALRLATDLQRAGARRANHEAAAAQQPDTPALRLSAHPDRLEIDERRDAVWATVRDTVGHETATALWLFYGEAMDPKRIAAVLGKKPGAVRVMLHRGRAKLRPHLRSWQPRPDAKTDATAAPHTSVPVPAVGAAS